MKTEYTKYDIEYWQTRCFDLGEQIKAKDAIIDKYVQHAENCNKVWVKKGDCTCGLEQALKGAE